MHRGNHVIDTFQPIGKQIDILQLPLDQSRYAAGIQTDGYDEDVIQGKMAGTLQRIAYLRLKPTLLVDRSGRETGHKKIRSLDGIFDGARPVLTRQELSGIHPRSETRPFQRIV